MENGTDSLENRIAVPQKNKKLPKELKAESWRDICVLMFIVSIIHDTQKVEASQKSVDRWIDKWNAVYTYNGILFSL